MRTDRIARHSQRCNRAIASRRGQMSFSIVAVLLLVLSSTCIVAFYSSDSIKKDARIPADLLNEMKNEAEVTSEALQRSFYTTALTSIASAGGLDEIEMQKLFHEDAAKMVNDSYPRQDGKFLLKVVKVDVNISFLYASAQDLYPELASYGLEDWSASSVPSFFAIFGHFTVNISYQSSHLIKNNDIDQGVYSPIPFLANRLDALQGALSGERGELENIVRYELSALAQDRVIRGYGAGAKFGNMGTSEILTASDVRNAVNLAIVIEQYRYLRTSDDASEKYLQNKGTFDSLLVEIMDGGGSTKEVDPADLFLSMYGQGSFDLRPMLAQGLYSVADALVLRWLDYFDIIKVLDGMNDVVQRLSWSMSDVIDYFTGGDSAQENIVNWLIDRMDASGYSAEDYRYLHYGWPNAIIDVPSHHLEFYDDNGNVFRTTISGKLNIDFPSQDIYTSSEWKRFLVQYRTNTHELAQSMVDFVEAISLAIARNADLPAIDLDLDASDGRGYVEELTSKVLTGLKEGQGWLKPVLDKAKEVCVVKDRMAESALEFVRLDWQEIFQMNWSVQEAANKAATEWVQANLAAVPGFGQSSLENATWTLASYLSDDQLWDRSLIEDAFKGSIQPLLDKFEDGLGNKSSKVMAGSSFILLAMGTSLVPGIEEVLTNIVAKALSDLSTGTDLRSDEVTVPLSGEDGFQLTTGRGEQICQYLTATSDSGTGKALSYITASVNDPWALSVNNSDRPNRHVTNLLDLTAASYSSEWEVSYNAVLDIRLAVKDRSPGTSSSCDGKINISSGFTIVAYSCWPLRGVDYSPTSTLLSSVDEFLENAWSGTLNVLKCISMGIYQTFSTMAKFASTLLSYTIRSVELLSDTLYALLDRLQQALGDGIDLILDAAGSALSMFHGTVIRFSLFGLQLGLWIEPDDLALGNTADRLRFDITMTRGPSEISSSVRFVKMADGSNDLLINSTMAEKDWSLDITIDPLMRIFSHAVEIRGDLDGNMIVMSMPEIERTNVWSVALSDIPGFGELLSKIPSPVPGIEGSVDAGLEMEFNCPSYDNVVINEFDQNPPGRDKDNEWVELFNPTLAAIDLTGWTLGTSHGKVRLDRMGPASIPSLSFLTYTFTGQALDNEGEGKFPTDECLFLSDGEGNGVDSAPWTKDTFNDGRSWQREYDGADHWVFKNSTRGGANGDPLISSGAISGLKGVVLRSIEEAFHDIQGMNVNINMLSEMIKHSIQHMIDNTASYLEHSIASVRLFVSVGCNDITTSLDAGISASVVVTGKGVGEAFKWMINIVDKLILDIVDPANLPNNAPNADWITEDVYLRLAIFGGLGLPKSISAVDDLSRYKATAFIEANLATFNGGFVSGKNDWKINFGLIVSGVTHCKASFGPSTFMQPMNLWLLHGTIYPSSRYG